VKNIELRQRLQVIRDGKWDEVADKIDMLISEIVDNDEDAPRLGCATTRELLHELEVRFEVHCPGGLDYKTVGSDLSAKPRTIIAY
jgi:hypothetical protein